MKGLRIQGIVRFAERLRRELARPVSLRRKAELREETARVLRQIHEIADASGKPIESLPSPSRRAYAFLVGLDWDAVVAAAASASGRASLVCPGSVGLAGLQSPWEDLIRRMAGTPVGGEREELFEAIRRLSSSVERYLEEHHFQSEDLTAPTRKLRGWLLFFARRERFEMYLEAAALARTALEAVIRDSTRYRSPAQVEFRPITDFFQLRGERDRTRIRLPIPMICFTAEEFREVAAVAIERASSEALRRACTGGEYQNIQAEAEALIEVDNAAGMHWDLAACFERVNAAYFGRRLSRPRLTWNRVFTGRKFGHFDALGDTVMVSCTLDRADLPEYVLDYIMYHELLHKDLGVERRNGRAAKHAPEFRARERRFARYAEAEALLGKLAGET